MPDGTTLTLILTIIAAIVWAVRIEGRVNGHDRLFEERKDQADERTDDIKERLVRIEFKLDNAKVEQAVRAIKPT